MKLKGKIKIKEEAQKKLYVPIRRKINKGTYILKRNEAKREVKLPKTEAWETLARI
jgi:hypothetical protein